MASWGASLGSYLASWSCLGAFLERLGASSEPSCGILGYLEPSWSSSWALRGALGAILGHLGRSNASRPPPSRSRGGGRGRGKPLPEGEEGGWKRKLPRPPTPRGLVGVLFAMWLALVLVQLRLQLVDVVICTVLLPRRKGRIKSRRGRFEEEGHDDDAEARRRRLRRSPC